MAVYTRKEWGARRSDGDGTRLSGPREGVVLHHTVTSRLPASATATQERARMRALEDIGFSRYRTGIAYNAIAFPSGNIGLGVSWNRRGTHTGGNNSRFYGLALDGDYRKAGLTDAQAEGIAQHLVRLYRAGQIAAARIVGVHSEYQPTACPGDKGRAAVAGINKRAAAILKAGGSSKPTPKPKPSRPAKPAKGQLVDDGFWGKATTRRLQQLFGTPADGKVSSQSNHWKARNPGLTSGWKWVMPRRSVGSQVIIAMQKRLNVKADGLIGPATINALSARYGIRGDGKLDGPSITIRAMQRALNAGKF